MDRVEFLETYMAFAERTRMSMTYVMDEKKFASKADAILYAQARGRTYSEAVDYVCSLPASHVRKSTESIWSRPSGME